jgi:hypothetical protein
LQEVDALMGQDAGFRCMFALLGIRPFFVTTDELFCSPGNVVRKIAGLVRYTITCESGGTQREGPFVTGPITLGRSCRCSRAMAV